MRDDDDDKFQDLLDQLFECTYDAMDCLRRIEKIHKMKFKEKKEKIVVDEVLVEPDKENILLELT